MPKHPNTKPPKNLFPFKRRQKKDALPNNGWKLIDWEGNLSLGLKCWFKWFGRGCVMIGVGDDFTHVSYSYGANSDNSIGSTRWHYGETISEQDMMDWVDSNNGCYVPYPLKPGQYRKWFEECPKETQDALLGVGRPWHDMLVRRHEQKMAI